MSNIYEIKTIGVQGAVLEYAEFATPDVAVFSCYVHYGTRLLEINSLYLDEDRKERDRDCVYASHTLSMFKSASQSLNLDVADKGDDDGEE